MIALVEGAVRRKDPTSRARHPAGGAHDRVPRGGRDTPAVRHLLGCAGIFDDRARGTPRLPDPDDDRRAAVGDRHRRDGPPRPADSALGRAVEAARTRDAFLPDKTGTITLGNRQATDLVPALGVPSRAARGRRAALEPRRRDPRRAARSSCSQRRGSVFASAISHGRDLRPVLREHPHERNRHRRPVGAQGCRGRRPAAGSPRRADRFPTSSDGEVDRIARLRAGRPSSSQREAAPSASSSSPTSSSRACASDSTRCGAWESER